MFKSPVPWYRSFKHTEGNEQADRSTGNVFECLGIYLLVVAHKMLSKAGSRGVGSHGGGCCAQQTGTMDHWKHCLIDYRRWRACLIDIDIGKPTCFAVPLSS